MRRIANPRTEAFGNRMAEQPRMVAAGAIDPELLAVALMSPSPEVLKALLAKSRL
jgi:hypothetical protein